MSKFTKTLTLLTIACTGAALWYNFPITMFTGLMSIILLMSWASIIYYLHNNKNNNI